MLYVGGKGDVQTEKHIFDRTFISDFACVSFNPQRYSNAKLKIAPIHNKLKYFNFTYDKSSVLAVRSNVVLKHC